MAAFLACLNIYPAIHLWKDPLPAPLGWRVDPMTLCLFGNVNHSPINRAAIVFMISFVPAKIRVTRISRHARAIGYSSQ